jgi:uncharacterized membrane protein YeaQ/YmgE (transglycosylase-associated protein family)
MEQYGIMGHPGVGLMSMLIIGAVAGYIAEKATNSDHGLLTNIIVGVAGAFIGGKIAELLSIPPTGGFFKTLSIATLGAILLLFVWRAIRSPRPPAA